MVGAFLRPLLLGVKSPTDCIKLLGQFEEEHVKLDKEGPIYSLYTMAPQERPIETCAGDVVDVQILEFPSNFATVGIQKTTSLMRNSLSSLKQSEWLDDGAVYASILCHPFPDDTDIIDPLLMATGGDQFKMKLGVTK